MKYEKYERNHVIVPGRDAALASFLGQDYKGMRHKLKNAVSSNSEDALTWSCFDILASLPGVGKAAGLDDVLDHAFDGSSPISFRQRGITPATALRLAKFFGTSAELWMNMQVRWDLFHAQADEATDLSQIKRVRVG